MKKLITLLAAAAIFSACDKTDVTPNNNGGIKYGTIKFVNGSSNPYYFYIDNKLMGSIAGKDTKRHEIESGSYRVKVEQASGYLFYPTVKEYNVNIAGGKEVMISFP